MAPSDNISGINAKARYGASEDGGGKSNGSSSSSSSTQAILITVTATTAEGTTPTTVTAVVASVDNHGTGSNLTTAGMGQPFPSTANLNDSGGQITLAPTATLNLNHPSSAPSTSSSSTPQPGFIFDDPTNATLCSNLVLSWTYSGRAAVDMTLIAQPQDEPQSNTLVRVVASSAPTSTSSTMMRILTTDVSSAADSFVWISVDVKEGWYIAKAFDTAATLGISAGSTPFFLKQGSDTSCFVTQPSSTILSPSQSSSSVPSSPASSRGAIGTGDIVGISLGITAGLVCLLLAAYTLPRLKRRDPSAATTKTGQPLLLY